MTTKSLKIVIASSGRRAHYIDWFKEALQKQGIPGEVIAMEYRATAVSLRLADRGVTTPAYNGPEYPTFIRNWVEKERPDLFFSMNDYELGIHSDGLANELRELGCIVGGIDDKAQELVLDKYRMAQALQEIGVGAAETFLGTQVDEIVASAEEGAKFVVKHRFGSGSSGLFIVTADRLAASVAQSAVTALNEYGRKSPEADYVIVQEFLPGPEYGVDGIFSLDGKHELLGVLARRTEVMFGGDPDLAVSADGGQFRKEMEKLGELLRPIGPVNADFRMNEAGEPHIIDINPRFGGGYPYCHAAGADMPSFLVRLAAGLDADPELLDYELGVTVARREAFQAVGEVTWG
ncbi:ATP-grasp domain-containing protein [Corynebacterium sp. S7]